MIAVCVLLLAAIVVARIAFALFVAHQFLAAFAAAALAVVALAQLRRAVWLGRGLPRNRARAMRWRLRLCLRPGPDHANWLELIWRWGRFAAWRRSKMTRPSLPRWRRYLWPASHSHLVAWAYGWHALRVPFEDHLLIMAPPRRHKTALLARLLQRFPGPAIATSTKPDLFGLTSGLRSRGGRPVLTFNPQGLGGLPSSFAWSPLDGADVEDVAIRRADFFAATVSQKGVEEGSFWSQKCSDYLRALFLAAAIAGYDMRRVYAWVQAESPAEPAQILAQAGKADWAATVAQLGGDARKTAATVRMSMSRALQFLADPKLAQSVLPGPEGGLDIAAFLRQRGTVYLIADSLGGDQAPVAALFAALVSEIRFQAARLGSFQQRGRLDPPLFMALDEAPQICPVPVPAWVADSGGKGVQLAVVSQDEARMRERWGRDGARAIWNCCTVKICLGGIHDPDTLGALSTLCGTGAYDQESRRRGEAGQPHLTQHPVMAPDMIRRIPRLYALLIWGDYSPVIGHVPVAWRALRYLLAERAGTAAAKVQPVAAAMPQPVRRAPRPTPWPADRTARDTAPVGAGGGDGHGGNGNGHGPAGGGAGA
jgi:type IV secretion system protein VirD4